MQTLDLTGKSCPIPVIETKKALEASAPGTTFEVIVDNPTSVENLAKFASQRGYGFVRGSDAPGEFRVQLTSPTPTPPVPLRVRRRRPDGRCGWSQCRPGPWAKATSAWARRC